MSEENEFLQSLPEDLRTNETLGKFKDVSGLAKSYVEVEKMLGNTVRIPGEDAGDDARNKFYEKITSVPGVARIPGDDADENARNAFFAKLGRPESPDGYKYDFEGDLKGLQPDQEGHKEFLKTAHAAGLTQTQTKQLLDHYYGNVLKTVSEQTRANEEGLKSLKENYGDAYNERLSAAKETADQLAEKYPQLKDLTDDPVHRNNPGLIFLLAEFQKSMGEGTQPQGLGGKTFAMSAEEAKAQIEEIRANPNYKSDKELDKKLQRLYTIAYPS